VLYVGAQARGKKVKGTTESESNNHGYDNEDGNYQIVVGDHVAYRYQLLALVGTGTFGDAVKSVDHHTGQTVVLKVCTSIGRDRAHRVVGCSVGDSQHGARAPPSRGGAGCAGENAVGGS
jgi:dual specificity tyrosine-phosphorylation-regulated kinase 2/3/4